ncbi:MAG: SMC-Scp complex subunit ScpB [Nitrospiraceae bacterium]
MSATMDHLSEERVTNGACPDITTDGMSEEATTGHQTNENEKSADMAGCLPEVREQRELKAIVEALLFVSHEPLPVARLVSLLGAVSKREVEQVLQQLGEDLDQEGRGVQLVELAGGYRVVTRAEYAPWIKRLNKTKAAAKLSRSALESLAIIAYKQPVVRGEIEGIRGVETSGVLRTLLERKLVRMVGRKDVPGRPIMYGTTKFFLEHFGLNDLSDLPPLREFKELGETEQAFLPMEEQPVVEDNMITDELDGEARTDEANGRGEDCVTAGDRPRTNR